MGGSRPGTVLSQVCETTGAAREVQERIARGNETTGSDRDDGAKIVNKNDEGIQRGGQQGRQQEREGRQLPGETASNRIDLHGRDYRLYILSSYPV